MRYILSILLVFFSLYSSVSCAQSIGTKKPINILVLHSYSPSYEWTMNIEKGIQNTIINADKNIRLSIEYMDSKRIDNEQYHVEYKRYLSSKYTTNYFDAVIASDDNALNFLTTNANNLYPDIPIVAVGINNLSPDLGTLKKRLTLYYERDHIAKNLELARSLFPQVKTIYLLSDNSLTSQLIRKHFLSEADKFPQLTVQIISDKSLEEATSFLSRAPSDSVAFLTHYNTELDKGRYYDYAAIASVLSENSTIPIFVFWEHYIGYGVLGGYVNRSYSLGVQSVLSLTQKLNFTVTEKVSDFPSGWEGYLFDSSVVERFHLKRQKLPHASSIVNGPSSYLFENRNIITVSALLVIMMLGIIITQYIAILRKKELNGNKSHILALQKKTLTVQKEMIEVLGEAIETRSGETGSHVRRVAKMSHLLGKIYGLPSTEYELIEVISPMHDVGKIGISEAILDKPGKLTQDERKIIEQHTVLGYQLLSTGGEIMQSAARIALEHHERWDGKGYPNQLVADEIYIFARITAITDVFDALMSKRCYKEPWPLDKVIILFEKECGKQFDPDLCRLFLNNIQKFVDIRKDYPD
ncbi:metal-dependent phosphohydrolase [Aliivibrio sifiae]|uniref:Metal-dependent phosphohydrolase n=2 Tax=Aliivibrio sifiae TaxID=566293 RepID=A0A2S7X872_9GAMM|nr:metal-dependent phosphohydrolase [Aliivibrio sifiae]